MPRRTPRFVAADLITQAEHGPDSPALLVTTDAEFADRVLVEVARALATTARAAILERALGEHGRVVLAPNLDVAIEFVNAYAPEHLSVDVEPLEPTVARLRNAGSLFVGPWAPESAGDYATGANHVLPTGGLARASGGLSVEAYGKYTQIQRVTRAGLASIRETVTDPRRGRRPAGPSRRHRVAIHRFGVRPMSPTPVTYTNPGEPIAYSWEATNEEVADRYGVPIESIVRFDLNTSPAPPELVARLIALGQFDAPMSEYPPADYRRLIAAAAARYGVGTDELIVGAGADEILDIIAKAFLPFGGSAVVPTPTYAMYRVDTEQRGATVLAVPRRRDAGWALDLDATRAAARSADVVWLCSPNNPTAMPEPDGAIAGLLVGILADAVAAGRSAPVVVIDEAYAEFTGRSLVGLRTEYPNLVVIRTASKAYALAGLRVGFAIAHPSLIARMNPYRPPGSISVVSVTLVTEALLDDTVLEANLVRVSTERDRLAMALRAIGWVVGPSVTNFLLVDFGSAKRADEVADGLLRHGLVPRTFPEGHPLADHLRVTIRSAEENDQFIAAAAAIETEASA